MNGHRDDRQDDQPVGAQTQTQTQPQTQTERGEIAQDASYTASDTDEGFLPGEQMDDLRERWSDVQASFVDDPRTAVQQAHELVTNLVDELTNTFTRERTNLESQWNGNGQADTEALRVALQRYRSFFNRLLGTTEVSSGGIDGP